MKIKNPQTLTDAIRVARLIEKRNQLQEQLSQPIYFKPTLIILKSVTPNPTSVGILDHPPVQGADSNSITQTPIRQITNQEAHDRRKKELCYYCDDKFMLDHRCKNPQVLMIEESLHLGQDDKEGDFILADKDH